MLPPGPDFTMAVSKEVAVAEHFDVIVVGTGAGGGTLARVADHIGQRLTT
jgi:glycerol-3-phosphate dehydrogenase